MSPAASRQTIASKEPSGNSSVASLNEDPAGEAARGDQLASLAHLLTVDLHAGDPAAVPARR
jgi:hypothetical protein